MAVLLRRRKILLVCSSEFSGTPVRILTLMSNRWTRQGNPSYDDTDNARNLPQVGAQISQCLHETSEDYLRNTRTQRSTVLS